MCMYACSGRALNVYHPSKVQALNYGPVATFNHTEDYGKGHSIVTDVQELISKAEKIFFDDCSKHHTL